MSKVGGWLFVKTEPMATAVGDKAYVALCIHLGQMTRGACHEKFGNHCYANFCLVHCCTASNVHSLDVAINNKH